MNWCTFPHKLCRLTCFEFRLDLYSLIYTLSNAQWAWYIPKRKALWPTTKKEYLLMIWIPWQKQRSYQIVKRCYDSYGPWGEVKGCHKLIPWRLPSLAGCGDPLQAGSVGFKRVKCRRRCCSLYLYLHVWHFLVWHYLVWHYLVWQYLVWQFREIHFAI